MSVYGFNLRRGSILKRMADQQGLRARGKPAAHYPEVTPNEFQLVPFQNTESGVTVPAFGVMAPVAAALVDGLSCLTIIRPNTTFRRRYLVNTGAPVAYQETGLGIWLIDSKEVLYDASSGTPAVGEEWGPKPGQWTIAKWFYGFHIFGANDTDTDPSNPTAIATQRIVDEVWGQTAGAINKGSSAGTVEVYNGNDVDTTMTVTSVKNRAANVLDNKKVGVRWNGGSPYLNWAECG